MTEPTPAETAQPAPESMDMSMRADANVQWANPDALNREQLIRVNALSFALSVARPDFKRPPLADALDAADAVVAWITDGTRDQ